MRRSTPLGVACASTLGSSRFGMCRVVSHAGTEPVEFQGTVCTAAIAAPVCVVIVPPVVSLTTCTRTNGDVATLVSALSNLGISDMPCTTTFRPAPSYWFAVVCVVVVVVAW